MELIKDYDCVIDYHPRKANVVANALSRKSVQTLRALNECSFVIVRRRFNSSRIDRKIGFVESSARGIKNDKKIFAIVNQSREGKETKFTVNEDGFVYYRERVCVPNDDELKKSFLEEAHSGSFSIHPSSTKMY